MIASSSFGHARGCSGGSGATAPTDHAVDAPHDSVSCARGEFDQRVVCGGAIYSLISIEAGAAIVEDAGRGLPVERMWRWRWSTGSPVEAAAAAPEGRGFENERAEEVPAQNASTWRGRPTETTAFQGPFSYNIIRTHSIRSIEGSMVPARPALNGVRAIGKDEARPDQGTLLQQQRQSCRRRRRQNFCSASTDLSTWITPCG